MAVSIAFLALGIELLAGYPQWLVSRIGHPVIWIGALIDYLDRKLNGPDLPPAKKRRAGMITAAVLIFAAAIIAAALSWFAIQSSYGVLIIAVIAASFLAQRSLATHVSAVAVALERDGLKSGRDAVSHIVGRNTDDLDQSGVSRAAIESLAENFSDGVVAPAFWLAIAGLPGIVVYKAINTADSMIGHKSKKYIDFGRAVARLDDFANLPASRMSALLIVTAAALLPGASAKGAWLAVRRDASHHRSPNAGWPEAAFAGALHLELAGPRQYGEEIVADAVMGVGGNRHAASADIRRALKLFWVADILLIALCGLIAGFAIFLC